VPLVLFEKPFCDLFRQKFGADVMSVQEDDARVLELRAEVLTTFMKDVRAMLDEEGKARGDGKRLELSAFVLADEADNSQFGLDLRRWTRDKLADQVFPYLRAGGTKAKSYDMKFLKEACQAQGVRVRPTFVAWSVPDLSAMMRQAVALYDAGADGITMWDGNSGADQTGKWSIVSRLGHVEEIRERADTKPPTPLAMRFHRLGDLITDGRYSPNWGY
jgi:hypothetical protein